MKLKPRKPVFNCFLKFRVVRYGMVATSENLERQPQFQTNSFTKQQNPSQGNAPFTILQCLRAFLHSKMPATWHQNKRYSRALLCSYHVWIISAL